jgi:hypothetical protein
MPNSAPHKLSTPQWRGPLSPAGQHIQAFLEQVIDWPTDEHRRALVRYLFRWYLSIEGREEGRLSAGELRFWQGRFYSLLPERLRADFPWEAPQPLAPISPVRPAYTRYHAPFRQYGFIAAKVADALAEAPQPQAMAVFLQAVLTISQQYGHRVEPGVLAEHIEALSGGRLRVPSEVVAMLSRSSLVEGSRASEPPRSSGRYGKGRRFRHGRRR